jgi:hypothetical protein
MIFAGNHTLYRGLGFSLVIALLLTLSGQPAASLAAPTTLPAIHSTGYPSEIKPLMEANCLACHGAKKQKGGIDFSTIADDHAVLRSRKLWRKAAEQLKSSDMPPDDAKAQPTAQERERMVAWMTRIATVDATDASLRDPGPPVIRRLTVAEYDRTLRDLLGIDFNVSETASITDDTSTSAFSNLAAGQYLSSTTLEKYFTAADNVLNRVFAGVEPALADHPLNPGEKTRAKKAYQTIVTATPGNGISPHDAARKTIERFVRRAYRRSVADAEISRLVAFFDALSSQGKSFDAALRMTLKPVLVSPHFLFRVEQERTPTGSNGSYWISDDELAVRLSYFLWSTMPDDQLFELADQGKLSDPLVLDQQVTRMLADPRARALTDNFAEQWLQIRKLNMARPSTEFFPAFTHELRRHMHDEATTFFDKMREEDHSLLDLLDCDYAYVNEPLAKFYGIPDVKGNQFQKVALKPEYHRGGLLGMGAVLAMTSHTFRTSPTLRGKYVLDVIFGNPPPPPPANAGMFKNEKKGDIKSFRDQLAQHASDANCAGCHRKMDPLGFALDNYNAIGQWRQDKDLDTTGQLPTGEKLTGVADLKKVILDHRDDFIHSAVEQMMVYALGRNLDYYDDGPVQQVQNEMAQSGYKFSALVKGIVHSFPFENRRNVTDEDVSGR